MKLQITESQYKKLCENMKNDIDERSRSFAFTRKKRLFSKPERMYNPLRYRYVDRLEEENDGKKEDNKKKNENRTDTIPNREINSAKKRR